MNSKLHSNSSNSEKNVKMNFLEKNIKNLAEFSDVVAEIQKSNKKLDKLTQASDPKGAAATEDKRDAAKADKDRNGYLKSARGYPKQAVQDFKKAVEIMPWETHYRLQLAKTYELK